MSAYLTSGYRAAHGLPKANHDPRPYRCRTTTGIEYRTRHDAHAGDEYMPRPEFDVPDNPILASFRGDKHLTAPERARDYLLYLRQYSGHVERLHELVHIAHARRVLAKLAAVYA